MKVGSTKLSPGMSLLLRPLCWTCNAAKIFHRAGGSRKLVAGVSRITTSHSVGQTIQSSRIGGTRRCSYPRREHYSSSSTCSFSLGWNSFGNARDSNKPPLRVDVHCGKKTAITCRGTSGHLRHFHLFLHQAENFCHQKRYSTRAFRTDKISFRPCRE